MLNHFSLREERIIYTELNCYLECLMMGEVYSTLK